MRSLLLIALVGLFLSSCVPVAWVVPPTQLDVGFGGATDVSPERDGSTWMFPFAVGAHPLGLLKEHHSRPFDVALGYRLHLFSEYSRVMHGPYLEATYFVWPTDQYPWHRMRLGFSPRGYLYFGHSERAFLPTLGIRATLEFVSHVDFESADCTIRTGASFFCGYSRGFGERSFGLYIEGQRAVTPVHPYTAFFGGLTWRAPASMGAGLVGGW